MAPTAQELAIVPLRDDQEEACGALLARAFVDDPIFAWIAPDEGERLRFLDAFFFALTLRSHRLSVALATAPVLAGASLWKGPDLTTLTPSQLAMTGLDRLGEYLSPAALSRFDAVFGPVERALAADVPEPRWYLGVLAVAAEQRGSGLGSLLMQPILERADRDRLPVTLETGKPKNLPFYRRHGFDVLRELAPPASGGPVVWTMKRPPRAPGRP